MKIKRVIEVLCILALIVMLCSFVIAAMNSKYEFEEQTYTVKKGDCLWYIANDYCPDGMDKWDYIRLIQERNNLSDSTIYPGQNIVVLVEQGA